ncbi:MAG: hypothetical protein R3B12_00800 [Candidatus Saccharimonadales bacterium]
MYSLKRHKSQKLIDHSGDTIVEVLIAITVLSFALGLSFATVSRSNAGLQANKEQYQAQQLANQQVEYIRASDAGSNGGLTRNNFASGSFTCLKNVAGKLEVQADCKDISMGGANIYAIEISCVDQATKAIGAICSTNKTTNSVYSIVVTWANVKGTQSKLELQYAM